MIKKFSSSRYIILSFLFLQIISLFLSIKTTKNVVLYTQILILIIVVGVILFLIKDRTFIRLFIVVTVLSSYFYLNSTFGFLYYATHALLVIMGIRLLLKYKSFKVDKLIMGIAATLFILSLVPLFSFEYEFKAAAILYALFIKFGYLLVYLYVINSKSFTVENLHNLNLGLAIFFIINIIYTILQFLSGNVNGDNMTGFFGYQGTGIAGYFYCLFLSIVCAYNYKGKASNTIVFLVALTIIFISALNETKVLFIYVPVIIIVYFIFIKRSVSSLLAIGLFFGAILLIYPIYASLYPTQASFLDGDFIQKYMVDSAYDGEYSINRFNFIDSINFYVLDSGLKQLFGTGIGTTYPSNNPIIAGEVFVKYGFLRYNFFLFPWLYVDSGLVGILFFIVTYFVIFMYALMNYKKTKSFIALTVLLMSLVNVLFSFYNPVLLSSFFVYTIFWIYAAMLFREKMELHL
ncbi:hypothetical protein Bmyc01_18380 [Bacillus mycoides]|nr:hypothetical protein Bmyc01_18380 [Bacillus mycoides]